MNYYHGFLFTRIEIYGTFRDVMKYKVLKLKYKRDLDSKNSY